MTIEETVSALADGQAEFKTSIALMTQAQQSIAKDVAELVVHERSRNKRIEKLEEGNVRQGAIMDTLRFIVPASLAFAGVLSGGSHTGDVDVGKRGQFFLVLSPELFGDVDSFAEEIENMVQQIKASDLLPGIDEVYLPGEIEQRGYEERIGCAAIPYPRSVVDTLKTLAGDLGIDFVTEGGST